MHFCQDELYAMMLAVPFLGYVLLRGKHIWHRVWHRGPPKSDGCCPPGHVHRPSPSWWNGLAGDVFLAVFMAVTVFAVAYLWTR